MGYSGAGAIGMKLAGALGAVFATLCLRAMAVGVVTQPHGTGITAKSATSDVHPPATTQSSRKFQLLSLLKGDFVGFVGKWRYPHDLQ